MLSNIKKHRNQVINEITTQGKQYYEQEKFFREFWIAMRNSFTEENNTSSATFILERFLSVLPLDTISKEAFVHTVESAYREKTISKPLGSGKVRLNFCKLFQEGQDAKYSCTILVPKSDKVTIQKIKAAIEAAKLTVETAYREKTVSRSLRSSK